MLSPQDQSRAAAVARLWDSAPKEELKFLVASDENPWPKQYLCILVVLDEANRRGTGYIGYDDLLARATTLIEAFTGETIDEATMDQRIRRLEAWGLLERSAETNANVSLSRWLMASQRLQLTKQGLLVVRLLERAAALRERRSGAQDARILLSEVVASLQDIRRRVLEGKGSERNTVLRECYIALQRASELHHKALTDYLRDLHIFLLNFGIQNENITSGLGTMLDRLEAYMASIHKDFRHHAADITQACHELFDDAIMPDLSQGWELARVKDEDDFVEVLRPSPDDLLAQLLAFFGGDETGSLSAEVERVQASCAQIVSRLRLHWQNLTERTQYLQQLQLGWKRLKDLDWSDADGWERAMHWGHHIVAVRSIRTAPNLGTNEGPGRPPEPRRRRILRPPVQADVDVQVAPDVDFDERHLDQRVNDMNELARRILTGRDEGHLEDLAALASHQEFRLLLEFIFHAATDSALSRSRLAYSVEFSPGLVTWNHDGMTYICPNARITPRIPEIAHVH